MVQAANTPRSRMFAERVVGLAIVAVAPTIFWTVLLCFGAWAYGAQLPLWVACTVAAVMFTFLVCIWAGFALAGQTGDAEQDH